jgi:hypothetical protein
MIFNTILKKQFSHTLFLLVSLLLGVTYVHFIAAGDLERSKDGSYWYVWLEDNLSKPRLFNNPSDCKYWCRGDGALQAALITGNNEQYIHRIYRETQWKTFLFGINLDGLNINGFIYNDPNHQQFGRVGTIAGIDTNGLLADKKVIYDCENKYQNSNQHYCRIKLNPTDIVKARYMISKLGFYVNDKGFWYVSGDNNNWPYRYAPGACSSFVSEAEATAQNKNLAIARPVVSESPRWKTNATITAFSHSNPHLGTIDPNWDQYKNGAYVCQIKLDQNDPNLIAQHTLWNINEKTYECARNGGSGNLDTSYQNGNQRGITLSCSNGNTTSTIDTCKNFCNFDSNILSNAGLTWYDTQFANGTCSCLYTYDNDDTVTVGIKSIKPVGSKSPNQKLIRKELIQKLRT